MYDRSDSGDLLIVITAVAVTINMTIVVTKKHVQKLSGKPLKQKMHEKPTSSWPSELKFQL